MTPEPNSALDGASLDRHLDTLGEQLAARTARGDRRRRRTLVGAGLGAVALATGFAAATLSGDGLSRLDPVAEARAAFEPDGSILHFAVLLLDGGSPGAAPPVTRGELTWAYQGWSATSGPGRWRVVQPGGGACSSMTGLMTADRRAAGPLLVAPTETAVAGQRFSIYSRWSQVMVVDTAHNRGERPAPWPLTEALGAVPNTEDARNPAAVLRDWLARSKLRDDGALTVDGKPARRLVGTFDDRTERQRKRQAARGDRYEPAQYSYYVDADSFLPIELRVRRFVTVRRDGKSTYRWASWVMRFPVFEFLPNTAANRRLLDIDPAPGTRVVTLPLTDAEQRREYRRGERASKQARKRCRAAERRPAAP